MRKHIITKISGMSLVAVLVAVAVLGVIAATLTALFGNLSGVVLRGNIETQERNVINYVRILLTQPAVCDFALRANPFPHTAPDLVWDFTHNPTAQANIDHIEINPGGLAPVPGKAIWVNETLSPDLSITRIYLRRADPTLGEGAPPVLPATAANPGTLMRKFKIGASPAAPQTFDVTPAKLVVRFQVLAGVQTLGSPIRELTADVNVAVDRVNYIVDFCNQPQELDAVNMACDQDHLYPGAADCPSAAPPCSPLYYIAGFDGMGAPICRCQYSCDGAGIGGPGAPPAGAGPGGPPPPQGAGGTGSVGTNNPLGSAGGGFAVGGN